MNQDAKTLSDSLLAALETERRRSAARRNEICDLKDRLSVALHEIRTLKVRLGSRGTMDNRLKSLAAKTLTLEELQAAIRVLASVAQRSE